MTHQHNCDEAIEAVSKGSSPARVERWAARDLIPMNQALDHSAAVPNGTLLHLCHVHPALKRWASLHVFGARVPVTTPQISTVPSLIRSDFFNPRMYLRSMTNIR
jgi:hypothetical protein